MAINIKQLGDGSAGLEGVAADAGSFIFASGEWDAASVDKSIFVAPRAMVVQSITARVEVAGNDGGAVTATIRKVPSGIAITSGTALHSATANLKGTAATNQSLTLATDSATLALAAGDAIAIDFTGTLTLATGVVTVGMTPL
jgi:hypothetical protein